MDVISVLREVETWSLEDRVLLASRIWDHLIDEGVEPEISEEQRIELDIDALLLMRAHLMTSCRGTRSGMQH